jgi:hypothetical protein
VERKCCRQWRCRAAEKRGFFSGLDIQHSMKTGMLPIPRILPSIARTRLFAPFGKTSSNPGPNTFLFASGTRANRVRHAPVLRAQAA